MTILEKSSARKCKALKSLVESGDYSVAYAMEKLENYHDTGKVIDDDYETLADYFDELMNEPIPEEVIEESPAEEESIVEEVE